MAKYELTNKAIDDLTEIWEYTEDKWSEQQANRYFKSLITTCKKIANNPDIGKEYAEIKRNLLGLKSGKHIIFYHLVSENTIEVIRIIHEQMDLKNRMNE